MKILFHCAFFALLSQVASAATAPEVTAVPEPSSAIFGGICGIIFLFWRKK